MYLNVDGAIYEKKETEFFTSEGINFGYGVFETVKVIGGRLVFFEEHVRRLKKALYKLDILDSLESKEVKARSDELIAKNEIDEGALKILVSKVGEKNKVIISTRAAKYTVEDYEKGFSLNISKIKRNEYSVLPYVKSTNYMENYIERKKAVKSGYDDCIFLNTSDFLAETSISNIFFVKEGVLCTPSLDNGMLNGIMREKVIEMAESQGIDLFVGKFGIDDLLCCEECFVTNSLMGIMPVSKIEDRSLCLDRNSITRKLSHIYNEILRDL